MTVKNAIGQEAYERLRTILARAFPGPYTKVSDRLVDGVVQVMWQQYLPAYAELGVPPPPDNAPTAQKVPSTYSTTASFPLYMGEATHHRTLVMNTDARMESEFMGRLPMVRVPLPRKLLGTDADVISTQVGEVHLNADHLVGSIDFINEKYNDGSHLNYRPARVDLITPARLWGTRFGAIALYLGYRHVADTCPSFYLLEAGTATGEAKMIYFGKTIDTVIVQPSWYRPTPFSSEKNTYRGQLTMNGNEPQQLVVQSTQHGHRAPYITVTLWYRRVASMDRIWPEILTLEAAKRVALIADTMGISSAVPLQDVLAALAMLLPWEQVPHLKQPS